MVRVRQPGLLLGEWACLGALGRGRLHGFAVAKRLAPDGDLGRVWTLSRPLTYRALATLAEMGMVRSAGEEPGVSGPNRTLLVLTPKGRSALRSWLAEPVRHLRDVRSELLLKLVLCDEMGLDRTPLIDAQRRVFEAQRKERIDALLESAGGAGHSGEAGHPDGAAGDPVVRWRAEFAEAAIRFLDGLSGAR